MRECRRWRARVDKSSIRDSQMTATNNPVLLFVDDDERIVRLLRTMFRSQYQVHVVLSG